MQVQIAALCDSAADYNGKLCLLGVFDAIIAAQLPAVHPQCSIALRLTYRREKEGSHSLRIDFQDADGAAIVPAVETNFEVPPLTGPASISSRNLIINIQQLPFKTNGAYSIEISIDGKHKASLPLHVHVMPGNS